VTNNHVVEDAGEVELVLASGERVAARVVATDPLTDLAVVEASRKDLPPAQFANTLPRVGQLALAMGAPLGFEDSVTAGIVSGLHRAIPSGGTTPALVDLVQTDAPISPGNSGGGLFDANGMVIGINVAYLPPESGAVSLGFAISSPTVRDVVDQLIKNGQVEHAFLGIEPRPLTPEIASQLKTQTNQGVVVYNVTPGSAADKAGMESGDIITSFDGKQVRSVEDLYAALRSKKPGDTVGVTVQRGGEEQELEVTLDSRPAQ
jgi:S1-C subfamily serine protease